MLMDNNLAPHTQTHTRKGQQRGMDAFLIFFITFNFYIYDHKNLLIPLGMIPTAYRLFVIWSREDNDEET